MEEEHGVILVSAQEVEFDQFHTLLPFILQVFISSDHGGHGGRHGSAQDSDVIIPLFVRGPGVKKNHKIQTQVIACLWYNK